MRVDRRDCLIVAGVVVTVGALGVVNWLVAVAYGGLILSGIGLFLSLPKRVR